jgi:hypothetical protein
MPQMRRLAALAATLSLALPASAFAQGAGETQYSDPLAGEETSSGSGSGSGTGGGGGGGGGELSTTPPAGSTESQAAQTRTPDGELARTGADPALVALLGAGFILTGAGLRVRVRRPFA